MKTELGLGLAALGRPDYINIREDKNIDKSINVFESHATEMLDFAYKSGIRYFDTAPSYGKGEEFLMAWDSKNSNNDVKLSTKWGYTYVANWQIGYEGKHEIKSHTLDKLKEQWNVSKKLLPNLKIYQVHSATLDSGILENDAVLEEMYLLKQQHHFKIGITTSGVHQREVIEKALNIQINGNFLFDSFQVTYNVLEQSTFNMLNELRKKNKTIIIKEGLANGRVFKSHSLKNELKNLAQKYNVGIDAVALRFIFDAIAPEVVLSGAFSKRQLKENLKVLEFNLTEEEVSELKELRVKPEVYWKERDLLTWD